MGNHLLRREEARIFLCANGYGLQVGFKIRYRTTRSQEPLVCAVGVGIAKQPRYKIKYKYKLLCPVYTFARLSIITPTIYPLEVVYTLYLHNIVLFPYDTLP